MSTAEDTANANKLYEKFNADVMAARAKENEQDMVNAKNAFHRSNSQYKPPEEAPKFNDNFAAPEWNHFRTNVASTPERP